MGRAIALRLGREQPVMVNDRHRARAEKTVAQLEREGIECGLAVCDVTDRDAVRAMVGETMDRWGSVDVLVNTAGGVKGPINNAFLDIDDEQWRITLGVNLTSAFVCMQEAARVMIRQGGGCVVNIGSTSWGGAPQRAHYAAAKAGLVALTRSAATQLGPRGVRVNLVAPGATETTVVDKGAFDSVADWSSHNPLGRPNTPEDIADAVAFLASQASRNISGQVLTVAGGLNPSL